MKRLVYLLIFPIFLALVFASGCTCPQKETPPPPPPPPPVVKETPPPPAPVVITLAPIYFDLNKSNLKPCAKAILDKNAEVLSKNPTVKVRIEGNCDERASNKYNMALGQRRANSAKQYLIKVGVAADRLTTVSYGEEKPLDPGHNQAAWAKNRRVDFEVIE